MHERSFGSERLSFIAVSFLPRGSEFINETTDGQMKQRPRNGTEFYRGQARNDEKKKKKIDR